jgi:hypothetical protein
MWLLNIHGGIKKPGGQKPQSDDLYQIMISKNSTVDK